MSVFSNPASRSLESAREYSAAVVALIGDQPPLEILRSTADVLEGLVAPLPAPALATPEAGGKWSVRHVVQHLADSELVWGVRMRLILAHDRPAITGYDQDLWADRLDYAHADERAALALFRVVRAANVAILDRLRPDDYARVGVHAERGEESLRHMITLNAGHDLLHLRQTERIIRRVSGLSGC
jgi:hypothetical protein